MTTITTILRHYDYTTRQDVIYLIELSNPTNWSKRKRCTSSWRGEIVDGPLTEAQAKRAMKKLTTGV